MQPENTTLPENPKPPKTSNKTALIIAGIVVLLLVAASAYMILGKSKSNNTSAKSDSSKTSNTNSNSASTKTMTKKSLKDLFASGQTLSCTVTYDNNNEKSTGTVYVASAKKYYAEFSGTTDGKPYTGYVMSDGTYSYVWASGSDQGFKAKVTDESAVNSQSSVDLNQLEDTNCSNWTIDNSKFTAPTNVSFTDYTVPTSTTP